MAIEIVERIADCLGSKAEMARVCGVRPPSLHGWVRIPDCHVLKLEAAVRAKGGDINRYSMRPDIFGESSQATENKSVA